MKFKLLPVSGKTIWQNNKPFVWFLLSLLLIHSVLKIIFYQYNQSLLFTGAQTGITGNEKLVLLKWSLLTDLFILLIINGILLFILTATGFITAKISSWFTILLGWLVIPFFTLINSMAILLNLADVFYFPFHLQRANADLFYVLDHPLNRLFQQPFHIISISIIAVFAIIFFMFRMHRRLFSAFIRGNNGRLSAVVLFMFLVFFVAIKGTSSYLFVPNYPLVQLKSNQLPFVQNSIHTFLYSVYRKGNGGLQQNHMRNSEADSLFPIRKKLNLQTQINNRKNIVLFIMESVPYDFFDAGSAYKVNMPFFDSLLQKSIFFNNAFCYAHESNKGITAILAGIPTISDVPVYHSSGINMQITHTASALKALNYKSIFCIGDEYDNFGFAKCANWLGFDKYYSKKDITGYKNLPAHSMGLQDEAVLGFFGQKISGMPSPFLAVHYNISTHFPYDIPASFTSSSSATYTAPMKAMQYYDHSLQLFFEKAKNEPWFANTSFIFCSDHWLFPQGKLAPYTAVSAYRIPIILYDPSFTHKKIDNRLASQFDIAATVLAIAGYRDSVITYGNNLLDSTSLNSVVFSKAGNGLYQVADSSHILGYNAANQKTEFLFNYKSDAGLSKNLSADKSYSGISQKLLKKVQAFLQKANMQYANQPFK